MKWVLRFFALLDLAGFILIFDQAKIQFQTFLLSEPLTSLQFFSRILFLALWLSLMASAFFLSIPKKTGIIIYYFQLAFRLVFFVFSFGFITYLSYLVKWSNLQSSFMAIIIFAEMLRVYFSYKIKKDLF